MKKTTQPTARLHTCAETSDNGTLTRICAHCKLPVSNPWLNKCPRCISELEWINPCSACTRKRHCSTESSSE